MRSGSMQLIALTLVCIGTSIARGAQVETFSLAEASAVNRSARDLARGLSADWPQQRYMNWIDDGNLVVAEAPLFTPRTVVERRDGSTITATFAARDGRSMFYISERGGPSPVRELLQIDLERGGPPRLIASGAEIPSNPILAPDGRAIAFSQGKQLHEFRLNSEGQWEQHQLLKPDPRHSAAVGISGIAYSPGATQIAFVSQRKAGQTYIALHDITKDETRYIEPGIFRDHSPTWSPDGTELAFIREPRNLTMSYRFTPRRETVPWSILAVNVNSGAVRTIWKADPGPGSAAVSSMAFDPMPLWTRDGRLLFLWEKTGWQLLYSVPAQGGPATLLTPGEGEVSEVVMSPDGHTLVYTANMGDLARTHLWMLALSNGKPVRLTTGTGVESNPRFSAGGYLSYLSQNRPEGAPQVTIRSPKGATFALQRHSPEVTKRNQQMWRQFLQSETVSVRADDGVTSHHVLIKPRTRPPAEGYPVIVFAHGGPELQTLPGTGTAYVFGQYMASRGYLFLDINYRGSTGFGLDYRLPESRGATGGSEVHDIAALVTYLKSRGDVNSKRIGIMGASYGGHIVGLAMTQLADDFAAGVSLFGVADWVVEMKKDLEDAGEMRDPLHYIRLSERVRIEDLAYASSPSARIENWRGPTLFTIGDRDLSGHMESVIDLGYQLLARGVPVEFYVDPAGEHNVFPQERVFEFFERNLR